MDNEWTFCDSDACEKFKPKVMTNGDRIRQMSNEELNNVIDCPYDGCIHSFEDYKCSDCRLEWLNAPACVAENGESAKQADLSCNSAKESEGEDE